MDQKTDLIKEDIDETRSALTEKLVTLEGEIRDRVETARETVEDTIENVRSSLRKLSPTHQVQQHPFAMVGGSTAAGILVGHLLRGGKARQSDWDQDAWRFGPEGAGLGPVPSTSDYGESTEGLQGSPAAAEKSRHLPPAPPRGPGVLEKLADQFSDEIQMVKGMVLGAALTAVRDVVKEAIPSFGEEIDQVWDSALRKVTKAA